MTVVGWDDVYRRAWFHAELVPEGLWDGDLAFSVEFDAHGGCFG
jgi:hypothetical protein